MVRHNVVAKGGERFEDVQDAKRGLARETGVQECKKCGLLYSYLTILERKSLHGGANLQNQLRPEGSLEVVHSPRALEML